MRWPDPHKYALVNSYQTISLAPSALAIIGIMIIEPHLRSLREARTRSRPLLFSHVRVKPAEIIM